MKLTRSKLTEILRKLADSRTVYQARKVAKVSIRRASQSGGIEKSVEDQS